MGRHILGVHLVGQRSPRLSGELWYNQGTFDGNSTENYVGVLRENDTLQEWQIPIAGSNLRGISIDSLTQSPWVAEESQQAGNGAIACLTPTNGGVLVSSVPSTAKSGGTPLAIAPVTSRAKMSSLVVTSTVGPIAGTFFEYAVGGVQPHEAVVDPSGNVWFSEPGANKIGRLSFSHDFAVRASSIRIRFAG